MRRYFLLIGGAGIFQRRAMIAPGRSGFPEIPYMSHPMLKVPGIFSGKSAQARPEELLVVEGSMASDRIRHVQYTGITRV